MPAAVRFADGLVFAEGEQQRAIPFAKVCEAAYRQRVPLFAQGYYRTPGHPFRSEDRRRGQPFHYFAYGAAVSEVEVDGFTGDYRLLRADILEDVGDSVSPLVDRGQIEGGFIQGVGWLTLEELVWDAQGPPGHRGRVHLQAAVVDRDARMFSTSTFWNAPPSPASFSAAKPWASRR